MMTGVVVRWVGVGLWGIGVLVGCAAPPPPPSAATLDVLTVPKPQGPRAQAMTHYFDASSRKTQAMVTGLQQAQEAGAGVRVRGVGRGRGVVAVQQDRKSVV